MIETYPTVLIDGKEYVGVPKHVLDTLLSPKKVTRVEVIDGKGRSYVNWKKDNQVELSVQDDGRTLKVFITGK